MKKGMSKRWMEGERYRERDRGGRNGGNDRGREGGREGKREGGRNDCVIKTRCDYLNLY